MTVNRYLPEGSLYGTAENREVLASQAMLERAAASGKILEGMAVLCDGEMALTVDLGCMRGIIPRGEAVYQPGGGEARDIAVITRVGKPVCFRVISIERNSAGESYAVLSRRAAQAECVRCYLSSLIEGDIIPATVTHLEHFGAFVDVGCGIVSLLSIDCISVSRISHPADRFYTGMNLRTVVRSIERDADGFVTRMYVSHKELLGTWAENAARFSAGQTVSGTVRSIEDYGIFVELTPNLAGLCEYRPGTSVGDTAAVYIKSIIPERMKVKLVLIDSMGITVPDKRISYFIPDSVAHIDSWVYSPPESGKLIETRFDTPAQMSV